MPKSKQRKHTAEQIAVALQAVEAGLPVEECCRKYGISAPTFYRWKKRFGGLLPSEVQRLRQLEAENQRLKSIVADLTLDKQMLQEVLRKKD